jgi:hypothetical protein
MKGLVIGVSFPEVKNAGYSLIEMRIDKSDVL